MKSVRSLFLNLSRIQLFNANSKATIYLLILAFIILLLAAENIIKQTFVSL